MNNILVFGQNGQVASALKNTLKSATFVSSKECNFENSDEVENFLNNLNFKPQFIINTSAYTKVDLAESEQDKCLQINGNSVKMIADFCKKHDIVLIHYSTDYVFDGSGNDVFLEENIINLNPINYYGYSKLLGEGCIQESGCKNYIIRISWVYSEIGSNFVKTMIKLMQEREELNVIHDQIGSPTYAGDVADVTLEFIKQKPEFGIYHFTNDGFISWFDFAIEIWNIIKNDSRLNIKTTKINPILTQDYKTAAKRGLNSRLSKEKIIKNLNIKLKDYKKSLVLMITKYVK
ncbi:MAG: hypothetical protein RL208_602 [Pseudomonadota bacterium]